uniref:Metallo-beta-lactamase domain-containing protein n=1 Tax=Solibacter usitatus (strain Ellin6076) TaxID=234267 RepID=Q02BA0_SOLUE
MLAECSAGATQHHLCWRAYILFGMDAVRLVPDPRFDPCSDEYITGPVTLRKLNGAACMPEALSPFDYVLLSHYHHSDNLDHAGQTSPGKAKVVLTTSGGAQRLGGNALGVEGWQSTDLPTSDGSVLR